MKRTIQAARIQEFVRSSPANGKGLVVRARQARG